MLATLILRAKSNRKIRGVVPHLVDDDLSTLQYADDTILFVDHDILQTRELKLVLSAFKQLSGLKINFHKSEVFCYSKAKDCEQEYAHLFGCCLGSFPFRYLGICRCFTTDSLPRGYPGQLFGLQRMLNLMVNARDSRFILVWALVIE
jgi:hypothetical protein